MLCSSHWETTKLLRNLRIPGDTFGRFQSRYINGVKELSESPAKGFQSQHDCILHQILPAKSEIHWDTRHRYFLNGYDTKILPPIGSMGRLYTYLLIYHKKSPFHVDKYTRIVPWMVWLLRHDHVTDCIFVTFASFPVVLWILQTNSHKQRYQYFRRIFQWTETVGFTKGAKNAVTSKKQKATLESKISLNEIRCLHSSLVFCHNSNRKKKSHLRMEGASAETNDRKYQHRLLLFGQLNTTWKKWNCKISTFYIPTKMYRIKHSLIIG